MKKEGWEREGRIEEEEVGREGKWVREERGEGVKGEGRVEGRGCKWRRG